MPIADPLGSSWGSNPFSGCSGTSVSRCCASSFWQSPGWPAPPKGTKKSCPYIRVSLREASLIPTLLRGSSYKGHPWPFTGGRLVLSRHPCRSPRYVAITFGLLKGAIDVACKSVIARIQYEGKPYRTFPTNDTGRLIVIIRLLKIVAGPTLAPSVGRAESLRKGVSRMDAAKGLKGHGRPL